MHKKYITPVPIYGMRGSRKTSWDGAAKKHLNVGRNLDSMYVYT